MTGIHEPLKRGAGIRIVKEGGSPLCLTIEAGEETTGKMLFDDSMTSAEFTSSGRKLSVRRDSGTLKAVVSEGEREIASSHEQKHGCRIILTEDSNILILKGEGFWQRSVSLIEYETDCWFLKFLPEEGEARSSIRVEVCPIFVDANNFLELLVLSVFELACDEAKHMT